jgi:peptidoglycan/xylan/chitin deacetylase (PgdA/CDA1 family)
VTRLARRAAIIAIACAAACTPQAPQAIAPPQASASPRVDAPIEVAVTVDDLPRHGQDVPDVTRVAIHQAMLAALKKHGVPQVYGFVNASKLKDHPEDRAALKAWLDAGYPLGNHTNSHFDLTKTPLDEYLADLDAGEPLLRELMGDAREREWKVFRYPFLREGTDMPSRAKIREHLAKRGYRIAEVTIDFYDWAYNNPYARCVAKKDERALKALHETYLDDARVFLRWSVAAAHDLFGRAIKHVLLLHVGAFDAVMLDEMLTAYEKLGVKWITLDDALTEPLFATEPAEPKSIGGNWLNQVRRARDARMAPQPSPPEELLDVLCR